MKHQSLFIRKEKIMHLSSEMVKWLNHEYWHNNTRFIPMLKYCFMKEFGYKKSKIPDSMPIEMASDYVNSWIKLYEMQKHIPIWCPPD